MKLENFLTPYTKINSKWIKYLNGRPNTFGDEESQIHLAQVHIAVKNGFVLGPGRSFPVDEPGGRSCRRKVHVML